MGDVSDRADVERFMRSETGQKVLARTRKDFRGRWISDIAFAGDVDGVKATISHSSSRRATPSLRKKSSMTRKQRRINSREGQVLRMYSVGASAVIYWPPFICFPVHACIPSATHTSSLSAARASPLGSRAPDSRSASSVKRATAVPRPARVRTLPYSRRYCFARSYSLRHGVWNAV